MRQTNIRICGFCKLINDITVKAAVPHKLMSKAESCFRLSEGASVFWREEIRGCCLTALNAAEKYRIHRFCKLNDDVKVKAAVPHKLMSKAGSCFRLSEGASVFWREETRGFCIGFLKETDLQGFMLIV